jgi:glyoxylase I family protein
MTDSPDAPGLPGLRRLDHIGFTVPDLAEAHQWLTEIIGARYLYTLGPFQDPDGTWMTDHLGVAADTVMRQLHFYAVGDQAVLEVFQYDTSEAPEDRRTQPVNSDVGGHHVAFYVDDLDVAVAYLHARGVDVMADPTVSKGPSEGQRWIYFRSPWGMQFELVSYPGGKAIDRGAWPPKD